MKLTTEELTKWLHDKLPASQNDDDVHNDNFTFGKACVTWEMRQDLNISAIKEQLALTCLKEPFERFLEQYEAMPISTKTIVLGPNSSLSLAQAMADVGKGGTVIISGGNGGIAINGSGMVYSTGLVVNSKGSLVKSSGI